jgi:2-keto-myo-inositol isomerase
MVSGNASANLDHSRFALNRSIAPSLGLEAFLALTVQSGLRQVELRNDIGRGNPVDDLPPDAAARMLSDQGIEVLSINAVLRFNLPAARVGVLAELDPLLELAQRIRCRAIVLCPFADPSDRRSEAQRAADSAEALAVYGPRFSAAEVLGYVEPLGYPWSSLRSLVSAQQAIRASGFSCYRVLYDTFQHVWGHEGNEVLGGAYDVALTGLVHVSSASRPIDWQTVRDADRTLVGPDDEIGNRDQLLRLWRLGYRGSFSFEPFKASIQELGPAELARAIQASVDELCR